MMRIRSLVPSLTWMALAACGGDSSGTGDSGGSAGSSTAADSTGTTIGGSLTGASSGNGSTGVDTTAGVTTAVDGTASSGTGVGTGTSAGSGSSGGDDTGPPACPYTPTVGELGLVEVATGFDRPVLAIGDPNVPDRLFVVEQGGNVRILEPGNDTAPGDAFLTVDAYDSNSGTIGDERGLLGFALHPDFPDDPRVYVAYNPADGGSSPQLRIEEYRLADGDPDHVDPASARIVVEIDDLASNHNGGMITFGPDGWLYIGIGDGGQADDFYMSGQNPNVVQAKLLRIGVEPDGIDDNPLACTSCSYLGPFDYTIPDDNPFVDMAPTAPEIYAWGFRNPWRFAFDALTGELYVGDVGQDAYEEIDVVSVGANYGWGDMEAFHCFNDAGCDIDPTPNAVNVDDQTMPIVEYSHSSGRCSVTGGAVYRSCEVDDWQGVYVYGDFCSGELFALRWDGTEVDDLGMVLDTGERILGNGWNAWGDVYVTTVSTTASIVITDGKVYRLAPAP